MITPPLTSALQTYASQTYSYISTLPPLPSLTASLIFPTTLILSQTLQHRLSITTDSRYISSFKRTGTGWLSLSALIPRVPCSVYGFGSVVVGCCLTVFVRDELLGLQHERYRDKYLTRTTLPASLMRSSGSGEGYKSDWLLLGYNPHSPSSYSTRLRSQSNASNRFNNSNLQVQTIAHYIRITLLSLLLFPLLTGKFFSVTTPSSYLSLGAFSRTGSAGSSPTGILQSTSGGGGGGFMNAMGVGISDPIVPGEQYASPKVRGVIYEIARKYGCHTCGVKHVPIPSPSRSTFIPSSIRNKLIPNDLLSSAVTFHADHMPPNAIVRTLNSKWYNKLLNIKITQRFYPQCSNCSKLQGGLLNGLIQMNSNFAGGVQSSTGGRIKELSKGFNHALKVRPYYFLGVILVGMTGGSDLDFEKGKMGGESRLRKAEIGIEGGIKGVLDWLS